MLERGGRRNSALREREEKGEGRRREGADMREKMPRRRRTGPSGIAAMKRGEIRQSVCVP